MQDFNDLYYFHQVVTHGGFAAAGRALRLPKSKLSRRVAQLEQRLGVRLIERSSRRFRVTEIGAAYFEESRVAVGAAERAEALVAASLTDPHGTVRFACPTGLVDLVMPAVPGFLNLYPRANLQIVAVDRAVDLIAEGVDVALRVRIALEGDAALTIRTVARSRRILLASPALANAIGSAGIEALADLPLLGTSGEAEVNWSLEGPDDARHDVVRAPRFGCSDFAAVREGAIAGLGVALLPDHSCAAALRSGALVRILPDWAGQEGIVHLVFTARTGLPPLVRAWIDHLVQRFKDPALFPK